MIKVNFVQIHFWKKKMKRKGKYDFEVDGFYLLSPKKLAELKDISVSAAYQSKNYRPFHIKKIGTRILAAAIPQRDCDIFNIKIFNLTEFYKQKKVLWVKPSVLPQLVCCTSRAIMNFVRQNNVESIQLDGNGWLVNIEKFINSIEFIRKQV